MTQRTLTLTAAIIATMLVTLSACGALMMGRNHKAKPAASEFGTGPRTSARGLYVATLKDADVLKPRKMYTIQVAVADAKGQPVPEATIEIGGGMPQHGHGFPTKARVTKNLGGGSYEIGGLRFNMGGWWELKLTITTPAGTDTVTFNLSL